MDPHPYPLPHTMRARARKGKSQRSILLILSEAADAKDLARSSRVNLASL